MMTETMTITNPYPEWQSLAGDMNCWRCYVLLWRKEQVKRHLCDECQVAGYVAVNDQTNEELSDGN